MDKKLEQIVNYYLKRSNESNRSYGSFKVQKIIFYTWAWAKTLLHKDIFVWTFEWRKNWPVLPELYQKVKKWLLWKLEEEEINEDLFTIDELELLNQIWEHYWEKYSAAELIDMTHREKPRIESRAWLADSQTWNTIINAKTVVEFYSKQNEYSLIIDTESLEIAKEMQENIDEINKNWLTFTSL